MLHLHCENLERGLQRHFRNCNSSQSKIFFLESTITNRSGSLSSGCGFSFLKLCNFYKILAMKLYININQEKALRWELSASGSIVFAWLYELPSWAEKITVYAKDYYFASRNKACEELPMVTKKADTMYRIYRELERKGLIEVQKICGDDYVKLTSEGNKWATSNI